MSDNCINECNSTNRQSRGKPDSTWSFVILCAGFTCTAIANGCLYSFGVILPELMDYFEQSRAKTALVGSLGQCVGYFLSPLASYAFGRYGYRKIVMISALMSVVGLIASSVSPLFPLLYLTYGCLNSIGLSFIHNASVVVVMKHFVKWRALSSGIVQSAFAFGLLGISQITRKVIGHFGWRWALAGWAMLAAVAFFVGIVFDGKNSANADCSCHRTNADQLKEMSEVVQNRLLLLYSLSFALSYMAFYIPHIFLVQYSEQRFSISRSRSTVLYVFFAVVSVVSRLIYCKVGTCVNRFILYQISMALTGIAVILLPYCKSYLHLVLFMSSMGFLDGGFWGLAALLVVDCAGIRNLNYSWGLFNCITSLAGVCGAPLAGLIADVNNSFIPAFYFSGTTLLAASSLMFLRKWTREYANLYEREQYDMNEHNEISFECVVERETVL